MGTKTKPKNPRNVKIVKMNGNVLTALSRTHLQSKVCREKEDSLQKLVIGQAAQYPVSIALLSLYFRFGIHFLCVLLLSTH